MDIKHLENLQTYARCRNIGRGARLSDLQVQETALSPVDYLGYFRRIWEESGDRYFGLHFGAFLNLEALHVVYDISLSVSTIRQLTLIWQNYARASFPLLRIKSFEESTGYKLVFEVDVVDKAVSQIMDAILMFSYRELAVITGLDSLNITFPYNDLREYRKWFDCPVSRGKAYAIRFLAPASEVVTNAKKRKRIEALLPAFMEYLTRMDTQADSFSFQVKSMLLHLSDPDLPGVEKVAGQFCMTPRTLQRKLKEEQTTFRQITNALKKELYLYLQQGEKRKTVEMSSILGYSSASAFLHALKVWELG
ncbi:MAG: AraC family transcriptional regulator ligand-binding domain-containing protein [Bacteroidota bacterium]